MPLWKQCLIGIILLAAVAIAAVFYVPGARQMLAGLGVDPFPTATPTREGDAGDASGRGKPAAQAPGMVVTAPVANATINDRVTAIGTGRALSSVAVRPLSSGRLTEIVVHSGAEVERGEAIARLDSDAEQIAVDRARLALDDANARFDRVKALRASNTVTQVQVTEAELASRNAELALREAQLALDRRSIVAPFSGVVGIVPVDMGQYVTSETDIATLDDRSQILVDFWVPERFAGMIKVGMPLTAASIARADEVFAGSVSAVDNHIDAASRTLHVEGRITNPADTLRAGMGFQVTMRFPGDTYPAVDPLAIQWGQDGAYVWGVQGGRARRIAVRIIQRNNDNVLVDGEFADGDLVVVQGVQNVREGAEVMLADQNDAVSSGTPRASRRGS